MLSSVAVFPGSNWESGSRFPLGSKNLRTPQGMWLPGFRGLLTRQGGLKNAFWETISEWPEVSRVGADWNRNVTRRGVEADHLHYLFHLLAQKWPNLDHSHEPYVI